MIKSNDYVIPTAVINATINDCKYLLEMINKELRDNKDIVKYGHLLFLKRKVEECDKMLKEIHK